MSMKKEKSLEKDEYNILKLHKKQIWGKFIAIYVYIRKKKDFK